MSDTDNSNVDIKDNEIVDPDGSITLDFTNELLPMTPNSRIIIRVGKEEHIFKPISAITYFKYNEMVNEADGNEYKEEVARCWLLASCMVKPIMTLEKVLELTIGNTKLFFSGIWNKSFLLPND